MAVSQPHHESDFLVQAYSNVDGKKICVLGLFDSAHEAAVALAQWKLERKLERKQTLIP